MARADTPNAQARKNRPALKVRAVRADDWPSIERLFGKNGACGGCWCMWWRVPRGGKLWEESKGARNKRAFKRLVTQGRVHGCLAFAGTEPVGWCCVGPRADFPRLERTRSLPTDWNERSWVVVCFYIPARWRHKGVATALLEGAVKLARKHGAATLDGYPVRPKRSEVPAAFAWTGVPRLFERTGFRDATPKGNPRDIYRKQFRRSGGKTTAQPPT